MERINFGNMAAPSAKLNAKDWEQQKIDSLNQTVGHLHDEDGFNCDKCKNRGYIHFLEEYSGNFYRRSKECSCMGTRRSIMRMKRSGLEKLIKDCRFENYIAKEPWQEEVKDTAMDFAEHPEGWLYLGGQSGAGKTHLCTAICRKLLLDGKDVLYMLWRDEVARLKGLLNSDEYSAEIKKYKDIDVLYIDDLFKTGRFAIDTPQKPSVGDINLAFELLNYRINNKKTTIISSECTVMELLDIDEAIGGRIADGNHVLSIGHDRKKNYRLKGMKEL